MGAARRLYILIVSALSLHGVTWAVIALLRNLVLDWKAPPTALAFWIAAVVVGLPVFLVHWLWAQRLARRDEDEREAVLRRLYLYGALAGFLVPFLNNGLRLLRSLLLLTTGERDPRYAYYYYQPPEPGGYQPPEPGGMVAECLVAMVILALLWWYHQRVVSADARIAPERGGSATVRRLYILAFSGTGLVMATMSFVALLRWVMSYVGRGSAIGWLAPVFYEVPRLLVGAPLWVVFWLWAQRLFSRPDPEERGSVLRKLYLYLVVFGAVVTAVGGATAILHALLRHLLIPGAGAATGAGDGGDIRVPLSLIAGTLVLWAYHAIVLRQDAALAGEAPRQASVRRIYFYLVAAAGLAATLAGLAGAVTVLIRSLTERFGTGLREPLAWFVSILIAGLPVWIVPWRRMQILATASAPEGAEERRSTPRKVYLYFYLLVATITVVSSLVYIVYRLLSLALGAGVSGNLLGDLTQYIAYTLIAVGVWLYHGALLQADRRLASREERERLASAALQVAVVDVGDGHFGRAVVAALQRRLPGLPVVALGLTPAAAEAMGTPASPEPAAVQLARVDLIIGPWSIAVGGQAEGAVSTEIVQAVTGGAGRRLLVPFRTPGWDWAGLDRKWNETAIVRQIVRAVERALEEVGGTP